MKSLYHDDRVLLLVGDCREILPASGIAADLVIADPPYGETSLEWDRWPDGWLASVIGIARSMWCFGSLRMFLDHQSEFTGWKLSQDLVWEKNSGSSFHADRFKRVHEHIAHWYTGPWREVYHAPVHTDDAVRKAVRRKTRPSHMGAIGSGAYISEDGGPRLQRSVLRVRNLHGRAIAPTQKPSGILEPLVEYGCPPDGLVVDPFAGSGSTLVTARAVGRRSIGIEADERQAERAARWLSQPTLEFP